MLSRLSSFSGPLSKLFNAIKGFTLDGLILRYEISDNDSYSGTSSVIDLAGNSNATLVNSPTYSVNGYLNLDGVNDYVMTNTSLSANLSPGTSSIVISYFTWIYPQDNGVIIGEHGSFQSPELPTSWHYSPIEMVSGNLKFGFWTVVNNVGSISSLTSSIDTPLNNWYYVGIAYDGTTMRTYVNGQSAGTKLITRATPVHLHYGIGSTDVTNMGDGSYAKMKFGAFHIYNKALSNKEVISNYNYTKSNYIYTEDMLIWIDANDPASYISGASIGDLSGNSYTHTLTAGATSSTIFGFKSFDCTATSSNYIRVNGTGPTLSNSGYTYVAWARITSDSSTWRTLYRGAPDDHALLVELGSDRLGFYDNNTDIFYPSGYDVTLIEEEWTQYSVVGDSSSSRFYINDIQVGLVSYGAGGNRHDYFGGVAGQPFGYVGNMMLYSKKLTQEQIKQNYDALKHVYDNGNFVIDNITLSLLPSNAGSSSWSTSTGTVSTTMTGSPTYNSTGYTFNGTSQYGRMTSINDVTNFTNTQNYTVEVWFNPASGQPNAGGTTILEKWNLGNISRYPYVFRYTESTSNVYIAAYDGVRNPVAGSNGFSINTWYQVVGVFNFTTDVMSFYKNGNLSATASLVGVNQVSNTSPVGIAHRISVDGLSAEFMFKGSIGIIRMYSSALSASDVSKNFEANRGLYGI